MDLHRSQLHKMPMNVIPLRYDIRLRPDCKDMRRFDGNLECRVKVNDTCNEIHMHAVKLNLKDVEFKTDDRKSCKPEKILHDEENEIVKICFGNKNNLPTGEGTLCIKYDGNINDRELKGIYRNEWNHEERNMKDRAWIMTKLDGCQARMAMPCLDDVEFKATFKLECEIPEDMDCVSNQIKEKEEKTKDGCKRVCFKETPRMATSSLCFTIGKLDKCFEKQMNNNVKLRIMTPRRNENRDQDKDKRKKDWARFGFETCQKIFDHCCNRFAKDNCRFPMEKMDIVVVPNYAVKGTGHLGLAHIREDRFYCNEDITACKKKQKIALECAKQIAKQCIGNIVNIRDRKQMWLEESLAKYMKYDMVDKIFPEWCIWEQDFTRKELVKAMRYDMLPTTDPMEINEEMLKATMGKTTMECVEHLKAGDSDYMEKCCRFNKGAAVLKMIKEHVGEQCFEKCVHNFLNKNAFKNANADDLFDDLERESRKPIKNIAKSFAQKKGFPIVHVNGKVDAGTGNYMVTLRQESVHNHTKNLENHGKLESGHNRMGDNRDEPKNWCIPMCITTDPKGTQTRMDVLMDKDTINLIIPANEYRNSGGYFKIDPRKTCFATVCYQEDHLTKVLMPMMQRREMRDPMDRFGMLMDLKNCCKLGLHKTNHLVECLKTMAESGEDNLACWRMMNECLKELRNMCNDNDFKKNRDEIMTKMNKFVQHLVKEKKNIARDDRCWNQSKMDKVKHIDEMLIGVLTHMMVLFRDNEIEQKARDNFWRWYHHEMNNDKWVMGDLHKSMFAAAAQTNDMKVADAFKKIYKEYKFEDARDLVCHGMGFFNDKMIVDKMCDFAMSDDVNKEDCLRMLKNMGKRHANTREHVWKTLKDKNDYFMKNYDQCRFGTNFFEQFLTNFNDDKQALDMCKFIRDKIETKHCTRMLQQSLEHVQLKNQWLQRDCDDIKRCLDRF